MSRNGKVIVAMSGGVDSSVAACMLREQGYECAGVFMCVGVGHSATRARQELEESGSPLQERTAGRRLRHGCCSPLDQADARQVCGRLGIPFHVLNLQREFERIIDYFVDEYANARTPNPCVMCNTHVKFGQLLHHADVIGAEFVATGHYARLGRRDGRPLLARALNHAKDQSYVLFGIRRENLGRCLFPLGEIEDKAEVRRIAAELGLRVHDKPESQEICFVPDNEYKQLVRARRPETLRPGEIRDAAGNVLGTHDGIVNYTVGQRRGLGVAAGSPIYVTELDAESNTVTVGARADLLSTGLVAEHLNWLSDPPPTGRWQSAEIKIRYQHTAARGRIRRHEDGAVEARFDDPQPAVTPGQAAVFYDDEGVVLGGGWIARSSRGPDA